MITSILSTLGGSLGGILTPLRVGLGVLILALFGALVYSQGRVEGLSQDLAEYKLLLEQAQAESQALSTHFEDSQVAISHLGSQLVHFRLENEELQQTLSKARSKEDVVSKKPTLIQRRINTASQRMFDGISEATGYPSADSSPK